jgi:hypothetical protein
MSNLLLFCRKNSGGTISKMGLDFIGNFKKIPIRLSSG